MLVNKNMKLLLNLKFVRVYTYLYLFFQYCLLVCLYSVLLLDFIAMIPGDEESDN